MKDLFHSQRLIIRADADASIGTGHVMRCLALAQEWQVHGGNVVFVGKIAKVLQQKIKENHCAYLEINKPFPASDDFVLLRQLIQENESSACQWVVVDGYHFTAGFTSQLRQAGAKVLVVDDYAHQPEYSADLLLNQNLGSERFKYNINPDALILLGNKYVLLRREFLREKTRKGNDDCPKEAKRILVTLGGADPENVTLKAIEALDLLKLPQLEVKIVVGPANPYLDMLKDRMSNISFNGELVTDVKDMSPLMKWADVAIAAAGSTCWELAHVGVAFLVVTVADNQEGIAESLCEAGVAWSLGWSHTLENKTLFQRLTTIISSKETRLKLSATGKNFVDGRGVQRVMLKMEEMS